MGRSRGPRGPYNKKPLAERFWKKVDVGDPRDCWEWKAGVFSNGYGKFAIENESRGAHRAAWLLCTGNDPGDLFVLHKCDNPLCVNPDHLFLGTNLDNVRDMMQKNRNPKGEDVSTARLTRQNVIGIRYGRSALGLKLGDLAFLYGVHATSVSRAARGIHWV